MGKTGHISGWCPANNAVQRLVFRSTKPITKGLVVYFSFANVGNQCCETVVGIPMAGSVTNEMWWTKPKTEKVKCIAELVIIWNVKVVWLASWYVGNIVGQCHFPHNQEIFQKIQRLFKPQEKLWKIWETNNFDVFSCSGAQPCTFPGSDWFYQWASWTNKGIQVAT